MCQLRSTHRSKQHRYSITSSARARSTGGFRSSITTKCWRLWEREFRGRIGALRGPIGMAALFKYVVAIAVIVPVVIILYAANMGEMFVGLVAAAQTTTTGTS